MKTDPPSTNEREMFLTGDSLSPATTAGEKRMETPEDMAVMLRLAELGWGSKRIAAELGCSRTTVKRYLRQGGWASYRGRGRPSALAGLEGWLAERFRQHRGNADEVRQELAREHGVRVSLRTVERAVADLRRDLLAEARACVRFETPPGRQLQIDFGSTLVPIAGEWIRVYLFVATLGYSRRGFVTAFRHGGNRLGSKAWRGPSATLAGCRARSCSTMPSRSSFATMLLRARSCSTSGCTPLRATGDPGRVPARPTGPGPRARTRTASATSRRTRSPAAASPAGRRWKHTLSGGCARLPISASMAPPASRRSSDSGGRRRRRWRRSWAGRRSGRCARWPGGCRRTARSISIPTTTACPGG